MGKGWSNSGVECQVGKTTNPDEAACCNLGKEPYDNGGVAACREGTKMIASGLRCSPQCQDGYVASEALLDCAAGALSPSAFTCKSCALRVPPAAPAAPDAAH